MVEFKFVIGDPKTKKSYSLAMDQDKAISLVGKKIGDQFSGSLLGLSGYELQITGGTDKDGFPIHPSVHGPGRKKIVLANPPGFHPKIKGQRRRKMVRGNTISRDIVQINVKILKEGTKPLTELFAKKEKVEEKAEEKPEKKEQPKEEKKSEVKKEKPKEIKEEKPKEKKKEGE